MSVHDKDHEDIDEIYGTFDDVLKEAWEKVKGKRPSEDLANAKFSIGGKGIKDGGAEVTPVSRESMLYDHLFGILERAILSCNGNDVGEVCELIEAYDMLLAIGMAKEWIDE